MSTTLELLARAAWELWGAYAGRRICSGCGENRNCRSKRASGPHLCLSCFDQKGP